jgi:uncharacterized protein YuzE
MAERLRFFFDREADILYLSLGKPRAAISKEVGDDIVVRVDPKTQRVVGCTILNLTKRFAHMKATEPLPLVGELSLTS